MRLQTVSTGCDGPEGKGRPRAPRRQDAIGARAGYGGIRRRARRCAVYGRSAGVLAKAMGEGLFVEHALMSASHHLQLAALGSVADVFAF